VCIDGVVKQLARQVPEVGFAIGERPGLEPFVYDAPKFVVAGRVLEQHRVEDESFSWPFGFDKIGCLLRVHREHLVVVQYVFHVLVPEDIPRTTLGIVSDWSLFAHPLVPVERIEP